jgi:hypothetical protein
MDQAKAAEGFYPDWDLGAAGVVPPAGEWVDDGSPECIEWDDPAIDDEGEVEVEEDGEEARWVLCTNGLSRRQRLVGTRRPRVPVRACSARWRRRPQTRRRGAGRPGGSRRTTRSSRADPSDPDDPGDPAHRDVAPAGGAP